MSTDNRLSNKIVWCFYKFVNYVLLRQTKRANLYPCFGITQVSNLFFKTVTDY